MDDPFGSLLKKMIQFDEVEKIYKSSLHEIKWKHLPGDTVIYRSLGFSDFISRFFPTFPGVENVINIDLLTMSDLEAENITLKSKTKFERHTKKGSSKKQDKRHGPKVLVSLHGFRFQVDLRNEFKKLYEFLTGEQVVVIFFLTWSPYFYFLLELCDHPVWSAYMKYTKDNIPDFYMRPQKRDYYHEMLVETGFSVISCTEEFKCKSFSSDEECKDWICSTIAFCVNLSSCMKLLFREEAFEIYLKHAQRLNNSSASLPYHNLRILVSKSKGGSNKNKYILTK